MFLRYMGKNRNDMTYLKVSDFCVIWAKIGTI